MNRRKRSSRALKKKKLLTVAVLTKNAGDTLVATLDSVVFADELLIIDQYSTDKTIDIALHYTKAIYSTSLVSFAKRRNLALTHCRTPWLLYIDSDEVVTEALQHEILTAVRSAIPAAYAVTRINYFLGKKMYPDIVERLFHTEILTGWRGKVHESPIVTGPVYRLQHPLIHKTHRSITTMLHKTNEWSEIEAGLRVEARHPPIRIWRLIRVALTEAGHQMMTKKVWRYGREGWFEGYFQVINSLIVYTKVWERQHGKTRSLAQKT